MRIIAGIAKGTPLTVPRGANIRPTSDRVRAAIFSSLGSRVVGADVLDLFAGSGALGLEAASRGARSVMFIERAPAALRAIEENVCRFRKNRGAVCEFTLLRGDVLVKLGGLARHGRAFSLMFADPPYGEPAAPLLGKVKQADLLTDSGTFVFESAKREPLTIEPPWNVAHEAVYGDTRVRFLTLA